MNFTNEEVKAEINKYKGNKKYRIVAYNNDPRNKSFRPEILLKKYFLCDLWYSVKRFNSGSWYGLYPSLLGILQDCNPNHPWFKEPEPVTIEEF